MCYVTSALGWSEKTNFTKIIRNSKKKLQWNDTILHKKIEEKILTS